MAEENDRKHEEENEKDEIENDEDLMGEIMMEEIDELVDPYTGEITPPAEDAGKVEEVVPIDPGDRSGEDYLLEEETALDFVAADEDADAVAEESEHYTEDEEIKDVFEERQELYQSGRKELEEELEERNALSPEISGGDLDADWQAGDSSGEETVGGTTPTPDQDVVEELGEAMGITYKDDEPLHTEEKLRERDRDRWELDPESAEEEEEAEE